jgi:DNA-binding transcriptional ArsR family regulator
MTDDYLKARKAGEKTYKEKVAEGEYPFLPALDDILPDADTLTHKPLGLMEIPVGMIAGTKTMARQNAFAPDFMPLLEPDSEFGTKWSSLYNAQISEGFSDPIKVYEYMHRFYVQEGNKRVSVSRYLDMPVIMADVTRIVPPAEVLAENPVYAEFLRFYDVAPIYEIETSWEYSYTEIAELLGMGQSAISHQLRLLRSAHLVKVRRDGKQAYYSLDDDHVREIYLMGLEHILE